MLNPSGGCGGEADEELRICRGRLRDTIAGMRPLVAITMGISPGDAARPERATLNAAYIRAVERAGAVPALLAPEMSEAGVKGLMAHVAGLVLTGGGDIDPARHGETPHPKTVGVSAARDEMEETAIFWALERDLPVLAICRGLQMLNVALGGSLHQHLPDVLGEEVKHAQTEHGASRDKATHGVRIESGSCLAALLGTEEAQVNSMHHQGLARMGSGLAATAWAGDGCIEGAEMRGRRFVVGVQWHPEEMFEASEQARRLFAGFAAAAGGSEQ